MKVYLKKLGLLFVLLMFIPLAGAYELEGFENKTLLIASGTSANFSLPDEVVRLRFSSVKDGSAEARRHPFKGYVIILDYEDLKNASDTELEGMFAHEFAHLETYSRMSWLGLAFYGMRYEFSKNFKKQVERETDMIAIENGFGNELGAFREYRLRTGSEGDKKILQDYYLSIEEIKNLTAS